MNRNIILFVGTVPVRYVAAVAELEKITGLKFEIGTVVDARTKILLSASQQKRIKHLIPYDSRKPEQTLALLSSLKGDVVAMMFVYEKFIDLYIEVAGILGIRNVPSAAALKKSTDKFRMRKAFSIFDESITPRFIFVKDRQAIASVQQQIGFPCMIKAAHLSKSRLVSVARDQAELKCKLEHTFDLIREAYDKGGIQEKPLVIAEEQMRGDMHTVDLYVDGQQNVYFTPFVDIVVAEEKGVDDFYNFSRVMPSRLSEAEIKRASQVAQQGILALGLKNSSAHVELMRTDAGWKIIEIGPRVGGYRTMMLKNCFDIDNIENIFLLLLGRKPVLKKKALLHCAVLEYFPCKKGRIKALRGIRHIRRLASFSSIKVDKKIGEVAGLSQDGDLRTLHVILKHKDKQVFYDDLKRAETMIRVEVENN